jgi:hypothetical protein
MIMVVVMSMTRRGRGGRGAVGEGLSSPLHHLEGRGKDIS